MRNQKLLCSFSATFSVDLMKFSMLPRPAGLLKLMLKLLCINNVQRRELYSRDFVKLACVWMLVN